MIPGATRSGAAGTEPSGICYRVLAWAHGVLGESETAAWRERRSALLQRMRDAGIKGSRGLLRELEQELCALTRSAVEEPLTALGGACPSRAGVGAGSADALTALAESLGGDTSVLAYRLHPAWAELLVQLSGEEGVDTLVARHSGLAAYPEQLAEVLSPAAAADFYASCRSESCEEKAEEIAATAPFRHITVLAHEAVELLQPAEGHVVVDATLGGGGHTELLLQAGATVYGIDQDPAARAAAKARLAPYGERLHVLAGNFRNIKTLLHERGIDRIDGLLADIGVSSPQVDNAGRGFSFLNDGPLDMRMNPTAGTSAAELIAAASESELADILWTYGEEKAARAIARRIVQEREEAPVTTTGRLADIIASVLPRKGKQHPATRSFQALRIAVNDELGALEDLLQVGTDLLAPGGRFAVITFHSLEDRAVKRFFERVTKAEIDRPEWPAPRPNPERVARLITKKPLVAGAEELATNPRSRSAKLRAIEKI